MACGFRAVDRLLDARDRARERPHQHQNQGRSEWRLVVNRTRFFLASTSTTVSGPVSGPASGPVRRFGTLGLVVGDVDLAADWALHLPRGTGLGFFVSCASAPSDRCIFGGLFYGPHADDSLWFFDRSPLGSRLAFPGACFFGGNSRSRVVRVGDVGSVEVGGFLCRFSQRPQRPQRSVAVAVVAHLAVPAPFCVRVWIGADGTCNRVRGAARMGLVALGSCACSGLRTLSWVSVFVF